MTLLFRILHAVHARGTHHKLVLDALQRLEAEAAEAWQRVFLRHADVLLTGAKAPDDEFRDFTNHVLHPRDGWWGGAPGKARNWYGHLVDALAKGDWSIAAYSAGVLSHYLSDPVQPFHTGQSEAENSIHRAFEWSVSNAYGALMRMKAGAVPRRLAVPDAANWLEIMLADAAREANGHYEKLIAHFDIHRAVVDPPAGLDIVARPIVAGLLDLAAALVAAVLERAIAESNAAPPDVPLALDTFIAMIQVPARLWSKRLANADERRLVERIYDELKSTGTVERSLPPDEREVRERYAEEVLARRKTPDAAGALRYEPRPATETTVARRERLRRAASRPIPAPAARVPEPAIDRSGPEQIAPEPPRPAPLAADQGAPLEPVARRQSMSAPPPAATAVSTAPAAPAARLRRVAAARPSAEPAGTRLYLTGAHDIVDAPSIGPRMAERLIPLSYRTVSDLLAARPEAVASALDLKGVDAATVRDWQDQARLVCMVPGLRGTHAQLLVGAGFRSAEAIAEAEPDVLCARVLAFAASPDGHRVLRNGDPPDINRIKAWLESARAVRAA
jgi:hypothetical protein